jgi:hypothetical protein
LSPIARTSPWKATAAVLAELACFAAPLALLLWSVGPAIASLGRGLWGPERPWGNGDFVGNFWCWWREAELRRGGVEWLDATGWPEGGGVLDQLFPNRLDAWLALPWFDLEAWWLVWNGMALSFLILTVLGVVATARLAGASRLAAAAGGLVLAMSPTWLHELGWGRMAGFTLWPGVWALAALAALHLERRWLSWAAPLLAGGLVVLQTVAYPFHGLVAGLACSGVLAMQPVPWRRRARQGLLFLGAGALLGLPWLLSQAGDFSALAGSAPPAGYTSLPLAGLLGLPVVPERFRLLPLALPLTLLALGSRRARPWALGGLLALGLSLGPRLFWAPEDPGIPSPVAALMGLSSWLSRMHHPVRAAPLGLAAAAVAVALLLDPARRHLRWLRAVGLAGLLIAALLTRDDLARVTTWDQAVQPPGVAAARWLAQEGDGPVVDLLSGRHMAGVALQPWHRRPLLETVQGFAPASGGGWSPAQQAAAALTQALARGEGDPDPELAAFRSLDLHAVLVVDRRAQDPGAPDPALALGSLEALLGPADYRDEEAAVWLLVATTAP